MSSANWALSPPFNTFSEDERPDNPLAREIAEDIGNDATSSVNWIFSTFPSQQFKNDFGSMLLSYAKGECEWDTVIKSVKDEWAAQKASD